MSVTDRILSRVRETRRALGLTQVTLASRAGVSLATLQNVEAGTANPTLGSLRRILAPLGLRLHTIPRDVDWDVLAHLGMPLMADRVADGVADADALPDLIRHAAIALSAPEAGDGTGRHRDALQALLWALHSHFPTTYRAWFEDSPAVDALTPVEPTGRVIKLSRIARERLADVL